MKPSGKKFGGCESTSSVEENLKRPNKPLRFNPLQTAQTHAGPPMWCPPLVAPTAANK